MVEQQTHLQSTNDSVCQGGEENVGRLIPGHDVDRDVNGLGSLIHGRGHRSDRLLVVAVQSDIAARDERERSQPTI